MHDKEDMGFVLYSVIPAFSCLSEVVFLMLVIFPSVFTQLFNYHEFLTKNYRISKS